MKKCLANHLLACFIFIFHINNIEASSDSITYYFAPSFQATLASGEWEITPESNSNYLPIRLHDASFVIKHLPSSSSFWLIFKYPVYNTEISLFDSALTNHFVNHVAEIKAFNPEKLKEFSELQLLLDTQYFKRDEKQDFGNWHIYGNADYYGEWHTSLIRNSNFHGLTVRVKSLSDSRDFNVNIAKQLVSSLRYVSPITLDAFARDSISQVQDKTNHENRILFKYNKNFSLARYDEIIQRFCSRSFSENELMSWAIGDRDSSDLMWMKGVEPTFNLSPLIDIEYALLLSSKVTQPSVFTQTQLKGHHRKIAMSITMCDTSLIVHRYLKSTDNWQYNNITFPFEVQNQRADGVVQKSIFGDLAHIPLLPVDMDFYNSDSTVFGAYVLRNQWKNNAEEFILPRTYICSMTNTEDPVEFKRPANTAGYNTLIYGSISNETRRVMSRIARHTNLAPLTSNKMPDDVSNYVMRCHGVRSHADFQKNGTSPASRLYQCPVVTTDIDKNGSEEYWLVFVSNGKIVFADGYEVKENQLKSLAFDAKTAIKLSQQITIAKVISDSKQKIITDAILIPNLPESVPEDNVQPAVLLDEVQVADELAEGEVAPKPFKFSPPTVDNPAIFLHDRRGVEYFLEQHIDWQSYQAKPGETVLLHVRASITKAGIFTILKTSWVTEKQNERLQKEVERLLSENTEWKPATTFYAKKPADFYKDIYIGYYKAP